MEIRKSRVEDLDRMMGIFAAARAFMAANGNPDQWGDGYPQRAVLEEDIALGRSYVVLEAGRIVGTFVFFVGHEPVYDVITNGAWHAEKPYGVIHRVASDGVTRGVGRACFDYCASQADYLRIDTHEKNRPMQQALERYGFQRCGGVTYEPGKERIGFDYVENKMRAH